MNNKNETNDENKRLVELKPSELAIQNDHIELAMYIKNKSEMKTNYNNKPPPPPTPTTKISSNITNNNNTNNNKSNSTSPLRQQQQSSSSTTAVTVPSVDSNIAMKKSQKIVAIEVDFDN